MATRRRAGQAVRLQIGLFTAGFGQPHSVQQVGVSRVERQRKRSSERQTSEVMIIAGYRRALINEEQVVVIRRATAAVCGRICYEAFATLANKHNFPPDFAAAEISTHVLSTGTLLDAFS